jgi:hypothetical protein
VAGSRETIAILRKLLHQNSAGVADVKAINFAELCQAYGLTGITTQWISRTLKNNKLNHDTDAALRPLVLLIEELVQRAKPYPISFDNIEHIKMLLDLFNDGYEFSTTVTGSQKETQ